MHEIQSRWSEICTDTDHAISICELRDYLLAFSLKISNIAQRSSRFIAPTFSLLNQNRIENRLLQLDLTIYIWRKRRLQKCRGKKNFGKSKVQFSTPFRIPTATSKRNYYTFDNYRQSSSTCTILAWKCTVHL